MIVKVASYFFFFFQAEDGIRDLTVTGVQTCALPILRFYNQRGTAEQWIKEGEQAVKMTRLSCHRFRSNEVRLWLSVIAYNLGNLWATASVAEEDWELVADELAAVKTGGRLVRHARYYWLLLAEGQPPTQM